MSPAGAERERRWFESGLAWTILAVAIGAIVLSLSPVAPIVFHAVSDRIQDAVVSSDVYKAALQKAGADARVKAELGLPLSLERLTILAFADTPSMGKAYLRIHVAGPRNHGTLRLVAVKGGGSWEMEILGLTVQGNDDEIDLLKPPE